jgi:hypothetical protein
MDEHYYTPEEFANKLLTDNTKGKELSNHLQTFIDGYDCDNDNDQNTFLFEILITIFLELYYGLVEKNNEHNDDIIIDATTMDSIETEIKEKFNSINYMVSIHKYEIDEYNTEFLKPITNKRYCKIICRHNKDDLDYFNKYIDNIDENKIYHMMLNNNYIKQNNLKDIYSIWIYSNMYYKIFFTKFSV